MKGRSRIWIAREMVQFMLATAMLLLAMHVVPNPVFCSSAADICECSFAVSLPAVAEHCGLTTTAKVGELADLEAALALCSAELSAAAANTTG